MVLPKNAAQIMDETCHHLGGYSKANTKPTLLDGLLIGDWLSTVI